LEAVGIVMTEKRPAGIAALIPRLGMHSPLTKQKTPLNFLGRSNTPQKTLEKASADKKALQNPVQKSTTTADPRLTLILDTWPRLSEKARQSITAIVQEHAR